MTINKYQGKTKEEAVEKARKEMGNNVVVLNVKEVKNKGLLGAFKNASYEVTAALEEKDPFAQAFKRDSAPAAPAKLPQTTSGISLAADEEIDLKPIETLTVQMRPTKEETEKREVARETVIRQAQPKESSTEELEKRLESLSNILEKQISAEEKKQEQVAEAEGQESENFPFIKMLYRTLLENDVHEKYANQIIEDADKIIRGGDNVDYILSSVYQKMILKFGETSPIQDAAGKPKVIYFIGPTGVGKTTTIAKIASRCKVESGKRVAFLTADTYRIAATEQLRVYANILGAPMSIIYTVDEMNDAISHMKDYDLIFVDTAGFSHKSETQCEDMKKMLAGLSDDYEKEVYLVLSATTKYNDLIEIVDTYKEIADYKLIFTKLDETTTYGNILNVRLHSGAELSYMTNGQNVPDDIEEFNTQKIVKQLLGGT
jgi:flagellar biosynthesis protein FlhF